MFYHVSGELVVCESYFSVIDCGGVGYKLSTSLNTADSLAGKLGERVKLYTHLAVREDAMELFGFYTVEELDIFRLLLTVSGVGPKAAISILSILTPEKFSLAVCTEDTRAIAKASGVGSKTAARVVLELKDKVTSVAAPVRTEAAAPAKRALPRSSQKLNDATDALTVLGFNKNQILDALSGMDITDMPLDKIIKNALKHLGR